MMDVQRELEPLGKLIYSGLVYGSLIRDVDILLVVDDEQKVGEIREELDRISRRLDKPLDVDLKGLDDVECRVLSNDFYLGSVFRTRKFYLANQTYLEEAERSIFQNKPTNESILFNLLEGSHIFDISLSAFHLSQFHQRSYWYKNGADPSEYLDAVLDNSRVPSGNESPQSEYYLGESIRNLDFSISYLAAVRIMQQRGELIDINYLLTSDPETPEHRLFMENRRNLRRYRNDLCVNPSSIDNRLEKTRELYRDFGITLGII